MQPPADLNTQSPPSPDAGRGQKRVVLVGATVRAAAESAKRVGLRVTGIDLFGDLDTRQACDQHFLIGGNVGPRQVSQACRGVPVIRVGGLARHGPAARWLASACPSLPAGGDADRLRDAACLRQLAEAAGMRFPRTIAASAHRTLRSSRPGSRWLVKQRPSCGGLGVRWYRDDHPHDCSADWIQAWIPGRLFGATLLSNGNAVRLLGICRSLYTRQGELPFVFAGAIGPVDAPPETCCLLQRLGEQVIQTTAVRGLLNVDFVLDPSGTMWLLEINPRWSASSELIERRWMEQGRMDSLLGWSLQALGGSPLPPAIAEKTSEPIWQPSDRVLLKRILFARQDTCFEQVPMTRLLESESIHDVPPDGTVIRRGQPICTLITPIDGDDERPTRRYRNLLSQLHAACRRNHSPLSSANE